MDENDDDEQKQNDNSLPGHLLVHVIKARNLAGKDGFLNKTSDPFCMVEVDNNRKRTLAIVRQLRHHLDPVPLFARVHEHRSHRDVPCDLCYAATLLGGSH